MIKAPHQITVPVYRGENPFKDLDTLASFGYGVYRIPNGFAIADRLDDEDGFYLTGTNIDKLCKEAIEFIL